MASIAAAVPQHLVDNLERSLAFYEGRLGFTREFTYVDFYAGVTRGDPVRPLASLPREA